MKASKNLPASVRQRLLNRARSDKRPFNELLQYYAMERFLYRLSRSAHADQFILKGALMLRVWRSPECRATMDIDLLGRTSNSLSSVAAQMRDILATDVTPDGLSFDAGSLRTERITEDADYHGVRILFNGLLEAAKVKMQIDVGFGDIVYPRALASALPTMLGMPPPQLLCYSRESAIAEKFEAMVKLGMLNSRMKDFYDIWLLLRQFNFDGPGLAEAIRLTFERRGTTIPDQVKAFDQAFIDAKKTQWLAFWRRLQQEHVPGSFVQIVSAVEGFLSPVLSILFGGSQRPLIWTAPGPWAYIAETGVPVKGFPLLLAQS